MLIKNEEERGSNWQCEECGLMNADEFKKCQRCETSRPKNGEKNLLWRCQKCGQINRCSTKTCKNCKQPAEWLER